MSNAIIYTKTDEAPALASYSLLPIVRAFASVADIDLQTRDISLAGRILANFPEDLRDDQRVADALAELGEIAKSPDANIIKLPNISASVPQLTAAIRELRSQGFDVPDYPEDPGNDAEREIKARYAKVLGSAVNPVLREGNSDRRVAAAVKEYARNNPHSMGDWSPDSKTRVSHMDANDFFGSEQSVIIHDAGSLSIRHVADSGQVTVLKATVPVQELEVVDAARMSVRALREFYAQEMASAQADDTLLSLHLKATMMKVSDPIMFGHAVTVYFRDVFERFGELFGELGVDPDNGIGDVYDKIRSLPAPERTAVEAAIEAVYARGPELAMVDSDKGITNLHVPSNVIIDASMPAAIRSSGRMWGPDGKLRDTNAMIPDRSYAGIYDEVIRFCKQHGAFDVASMGNVANVGLMAQKAEEYGSHDKTFEIGADGAVHVLNEAGDTIMKHTVEAGDIWRMCQTRDLPIRNWVELAANRARQTGATAIFWLDETRAHDRNLITKVERCLGLLDTRELDIRVMAPVDAMRLTLERVKDGKDTISVTGNVLRDYLTDLFPILELGTSAKMLSIVPLLNGGGLYETGAGGSAPKHVQQFLEEGHLRWDSLGEFLAIAVSIEELAEKQDNGRARALAAALHKANGRYLENDKSPSRKAGELDNRGSHYWLARYWAEGMAEMSGYPAMAERFAAVARALAENEATILDELKSAQGAAVDIGGYYHPDDDAAIAAMRPSPTLNGIVDSIAPADSTAASKR